MTRTLVVLLEEPSAKALLEGLLPRLIPADVDVVYLVFEGKQDLEKNVTHKLARWQRPDSAFVIMRDQDAGACENVKKQLRDRVVASGRTALIRIACRELEAWVAGDLEALAKAFDAPEHPVVFAWGIDGKARLKATDDVSGVWIRMEYNTADTLVATVLANEGRAVDALTQVAWRA